MSQDDDALIAELRDFPRLAHARGSDGVNRYTHAIEIMDPLAMRAADRLAALLAENAKFKQREQLYLGPDCHGFFVAGKGYEPACTRYKSAFAAANARVEALVGKDGTDQGIYVVGIRQGQREMFEKLEKYVEHPRWCKWFTVGWKCTCGIHSIRSALAAEAGDSK